MRSCLTGPLVLNDRPQREVSCLFFFFLSVLFYFPKNQALWLLKEENGQDGY